MGFLPQITKILAAIPKQRQSMLFSATMPESILKIVAKHMKLPVHVEIARQGTMAEKVTQELFIIQKDAKARLLDKILAERRGSVLVFSRTKHGAKKIARQVRDMGHTAAEIHANRSLAQRREALDGFKSGKYRILVATDIAARGIDVKNIELVVNYDLPDNPEDYVHRIGRTGRAGESGHAISFATPDQRSDIRDIERLIRKPLPVAHVTELPAARPASKFVDRDDTPRFGGGRSFGGRSGGRQGQRPSFGDRRPFNASRPQTNRSTGGYARPQADRGPAQRSDRFPSDRRGFTQSDRRSNDSRPSQGRRLGSSGRSGGAPSGSPRTVRVTW
jgi:ATP-dependent RNA helicase RhlE